MDKDFPRTNRLYKILNRNAWQIIKKNTTSMLVEKIPNRHHHATAERNSLINNAIDKCIVSPRTRRKQRAYIGLTETVILQPYAIF